MTIKTRLNKNAKSEFGEGLVICLIKFAEHAEAYGRWKKEFEFLRQPGPDFVTRNRYFGESRTVEMFFNAASDHLYGLRTPKGWSREHPKVYRLVIKLRSFGLMIGHGFTGREHTEKDVTKAYDLCRKIALELDKMLGLEPDIGQF